MTAHVLSQADNITASVGGREHRGFQAKSHTIRLFPRTTGSEAETDPGGPSSPLEQQHREYDTEGETEGGADDHGRDGAVPLLCIIIVFVPD